MEKLKDVLKRKKAGLIIALIIIIILGIFSKSTIVWLFLILFGIEMLIDYFKEQKYVSNLSLELKQELQEELKNVLLTNNEWYLTDKYIFITSPNIRVIKYEDIILMYYKMHISPSKCRSRLYQQVVIVLNTGKKYKFTVETSNNEDFIKCATIIAEKNKKVLIEKTRENLKVLNDKYNLKLK